MREKKCSFKIAERHDLANARDVEDAGSSSSTRSKNSDLGRLDLAAPSTTYKQAKMAATCSENPIFDSSHTWLAPYSEGSDGFVSS